MKTLVLLVEFIDKETGEKLKPGDLLCNVSEERAGNIKANGWAVELPIPEGTAELEKKVAELTKQVDGVIAELAKVAEERDKLKGENAELKKKVPK